jgi:UDP-GlcNAc3NAcA epimerase
MRIVTVVGARPQFIKAAVVSREIRARDTLSETIVHTGQHFDRNMSDIFFENMEIPSPEYNLEVNGLNHGAMTGQMMEKLEKVLLDERPDMVLVYGDTNSTLAGAVTAVKLHIPIAHVEAGLRSYNRRMPEEINRVLTDHASDLLFAPTSTAVENLRREGLPENRIRLVGDVMYDAALYFGRRAEASSQILKALELTSREYLLATVHRAENTDDPRRLEAICDGLLAAASRRPVVFPLHPRTREALRRVGRLEDIEKGLAVIEPVGYLDMIVLEKNACLVVTDSGGVQKEAYFYRVPCVTLRPETEWVELVTSGWNLLADPIDAATVEEALETHRVPDNDDARGLYGDGTTARQIVQELLSL